MKNLNSKLFQELELSNSNSEQINGGSYTSATSDTNYDQGGHDISFETFSEGGSSTGTDTVRTNLEGGTRDAPTLR